MNRNRFANAACVGIVCTLLGSTIGRADVVVYKESCGRNAYEDWNLTCRIDRNTFKTGSGDFWADTSAGLQSITICAAFGNRGGLSVPAIIVHNGKEGAQSLPTNRFDTVKFQGGLIAGKVSWVGTGARHWQSARTMRGELVLNMPQRSFVYTETLSDGQRLVGEIRATCSPLED